jgi:hypothetical protein
VQRGTARIAGLRLPESKKLRLRRLVPGAVAKHGDEVVVPVRGNGAAVPGMLVELLGDLMPVGDGTPVGSTAP